MRIGSFFMSGECELCNEHCLDCKCLVVRKKRMTESNPIISESDLIDLIHWARRYCDYRMTYAPSSFNEIYKRIRSDNPDMIRCKDLPDSTLMNNGSYWPYAQDGNYNPDTGAFDARK